LSIKLNAFPLSIPRGATIDACVVAYEYEKFKSLKSQGKNKYVCYRKGDSTLIFYSSEEAPISGEFKTYNLSDNYRIFCYLVKDGVASYLRGLKRNPIGFNPIGFVSTKPEDNLLKKVINTDFPFSITVKYKMDVRLIKNHPHLIIDCSTKTLAIQDCSYFYDQGFDLVGRYVTEKKDDGYYKLLGKIDCVNGDVVKIIDKDQQLQTYVLSDIYLEASRTNLDDYIRHNFGNQANTIIDKIRITISEFNSGVSKKERISTLKNHFQAKKITLINGEKVDISDAIDLRSECVQFDNPNLVFNDNGQANWVEKGLKDYGPYTKRTFDRNNPSICLICSQHDKGRVEQFVTKFLKGIPNHKYFSSGLEGKFTLGTSNVEIFTFQDDGVEDYKSAIKSAIEKKSQDGGKWDLAIVQVRQSFKTLNVQDNPYYIGKSLFFLHQVPVQDFTIELLSQNDSTLGYSLNNMALASYAKMGGVPWLLKSSPTISHELVVGIGSAAIGGRGNSQRVMGITTVFSGDGSYLVSNASRAVTPDEYRGALTEVLSQTINKIKTRMNWQTGDTIRLIFHASVKKFSRDEINAVKSLMANYSEYNIEYTFLKISEDHGLHLFDTSTAGEYKGKFAPARGKYLQLSDYEMLVYLIGGKQLKQVSDGHPRGLILNIHRDSTFKDIKYLGNQLFNFSAHSWRSYFPSPMPVTISYSNLIARNLGWLNQVPSWDDSIMIGKLGQTQWFL